MAFWGHFGLGLQEESSDPAFLPCPAWAGLCPPVPGPAAGSVPGPGAHSWADSSEDSRLEVALPMGTEPPPCTAAPWGLRAGTEERQTDRQTPPDGAGHLISTPSAPAWGQHPSPAAREPWSAHPGAVMGLCVAAALPAPRCHHPRGSQHGDPSRAGVGMGRDPGNAALHGPAGTGSAAAPGAPGSPANVSMASC